jgi:hypothetical protein
MPYLLSCHSLAKAKEGSFVRRDYDGLFSSAEQVIREAPSPTQLKQHQVGHVRVIDILQVTEYA